MINIVPTQMTVADYCAAMKRGEIVVNRDYQRSDKVWPESARSYLIETAVLHYPMPKLYLRQIVDPRSRKTIKEIVDGQQRSTAIQDFYEGHLRLSEDLENDDLRGKVYSDLDEADQSKFLSFAIGLDLLIGATHEEVVEVFRRMNSYTVPLNAEEQRHAYYQGQFKWFVNRLTSQFSRVFLDAGVFTEKQLVRMADAKLLTELCDAIVNDIRTTNKTILDHLYKERNSSFPEEKDLTKRIVEAVSQLGAWKAIHKTVLMKSYVIYSLLLAITHVRKPVPQFQRIFRSTGAGKLDEQLVSRNLSSLADALENDGNDRYQEFVDACSSKTNVREQRARRFRILCEALVSKSF
ncbi:MAG: DUF262 domain-containing protein [Candidatus Binatales bacterium]